LSESVVPAAKMVISEKRILNSGLGFQMFFKAFNSRKSFI
jgi:hypothetical protein